ncbi:MAG TPA: hypothetical protein VIY86_11060 [Pirellulaceae bacterium]
MTRWESWRNPILPGPVDADFTESISFAARISHFHERIRMLLDPPHHCGCPGLTRPIALAGLAICVLSGCTARDSVWREQLDPVARETLLPEDSVVLETAMISLAGYDTEGWERIWSEVDEQAVPAKVRRALNRNGFRLGILGLTLPDELRALLAATEQGRGAAALPPDDTDLPWAHQRLRVRFGKRHELVTGDPRENLTIFTSRGGQILGRTFPEGQALFALSAHPAEGDATLLELAPEVHYGAPKPRVIAREGAFRYQVARERETYPHLLIRVPLGAGQTMILGAADLNQSLGSGFFAHEGEQKLLLIRLAATPRRKLFADSKGSS